MMIKKWFQIVLLFLCTSACAQEFDDIATLKVSYQAILDQFDSLRIKDLAEQNAALPLFFMQFNFDYATMIQHVHHDLSKVNKRIRQYKKNKLPINDRQYLDMIWLQNELQVLYKFLKKYRVLYEAIYFEQQVGKRFELFFNAVRQGLDIESRLNDFGIAKNGREGLKILLKSVVRDLNKVEYDERRLHADWIDAKLSNYVLKIELVRLRNAILFHPLYKKVRFVFSSNYPR